LIDPSRLAPRVARELEDQDNEIWLSPISVWETLVLARKGRVNLEGQPDSWIREALSKAGIRQADMNHEVALRSAALNFSHGDPADRFLAATAIIYDLTLVTADERILRSRACSTLANR
jgi:PIN domain nuclease of toxin-antitoxin system